jgi:hypothetical protein
MDGRGLPHRSDEVARLPAGFFLPGPTIPFRLGLTAPNEGA